jgi:cold-inducible RNA-binding protein
MILDGNRCRVLPFPCKKLTTTQGDIKTMKSLFVGNMSFQTTEAELRSLIEPLGKITRVQIVTDRDTGRARGFAFVEMPNDDEATKAIAALNGKEVSGRSLNVNEARPKIVRSRPRSDGGGRGAFSHEDYSEAARKPREPRW